MENWHEPKTFSLKFPHRDKTVTVWMKVEDYCTSIEKVRIEDHDWKHSGVVRETYTQNDDGWRLETVMYEEFNGTHWEEIEDLEEGFDPLDGVQMPWWSVSVGLDDDDEPSKEPKTKGCGM